MDCIVTHRFVTIFRFYRDTTIVSEAAYSVSSLVYGMMNEEQHTISQDN